MVKSKYMSFEAMRRDRPDEPDHQIGRVVRVNKIKNAVDVTIGGALDSVADNVPLVASESTLNVNVGDDVALARFSGSWVAIGVVGKGRRTTNKFHSLETFRSLKSYGELMVHGQSYEYGNSYHHGNSYFYGDSFFIGQVYGLGDFSGWAGLEDNAGNPVNPDVDDRIQITDDGVINADVDGTGKILELSIDQAQISHDSIADVAADDHHAQVHVLADTTGLGPDHTTSGLTAGYVLRASGATTAVFAQLSHADLASVTSDQHHARQHALDATADHTGISGTLNNFMSLNANGLPQDSGYDAADFATSGHAHTEYFEVAGETSDAKLYSGADLIVYSGAGTGEVARIDGATGNITTSGTVDGVDLAGFKSSYDSHDHSAADPTQVDHANLTNVTADQHHAGFIGLEDNAASPITPAADDRIQVTDDGIINADAGTNVLALSFDIDALTEEATPASNDWLILEKNAGGTFRKAQVGNLGGHSQSHVIATTAGLGADHTTSGLTAGQVLRATGATTAAFASLQSGDLPSHSHSHDTDLTGVSSDDHHAQDHVLATNTALGATHTISGTSSGQVLRASSSSAANFQQLVHADLGTVTSDQHHAQNHVLATNTALGATHTISGTSAGHVLRASSSSAANFQQLVHADLGTVTSDQHHAQNHVLATTAGLGSTHTTSGLTAGQVLRATGATTAAFASLQATDLAAHVLATTSGLGAQHTTSGLTAGYVLRASGASAAAFAQLAHTDLGSVTSDQHHAQNHVLATNAALGSTHTISGTSAGQVLRASSSSAANFQQLVHADLGSVTSDQHHAQNHVLASTSGLGATHTVSGLTAGQFLRATGAATAAFQTIQSSDLPSHASTHLPSGGDALTTAAPGADSVNVAASGAGSANSLARSDHTHNLDEAIAPTWTGKHTFTNATAIEIDVATGDPVIIFDTQGADKFVMGVDDSVTGDPFVISSGGALGTNNVMSIASTGEIELSADSSIIWDERAAPSTPGSGKWKTYFKTDGLYYMDDAGVETGPLAESAAPADAGASEVLAWIGWY